MSVSTYSNGSFASQTSSSYGSLGSFGRWKLDEQKRRLREAKRRASGCVQEIKALKEECSWLNARISKHEATQESLQEAKLQLQASTASYQQVAEVDEQLRDTRKQMRADKTQLEKASKLLEERLEDQRVMYEQLLAEERAIQKAEIEETSSTDAALQTELKHLSEEMLRLQGLCQEMHGVCNNVKAQENIWPLVLRATDENTISGLSLPKRFSPGVSGRDSALRCERDQLERELAAAKAVADSISREAEDKAAKRQQEVAALTAEKESLEAKVIELSCEVPLLTAQNQQLKNEQEAQARRTEELQRTIEYMQQWQEVLKEKVAQSTEKSEKEEGGDASAERKRQEATAKRLNFESGECAVGGGLEDAAMQETEECSSMFVQGLEQAMVGIPVNVRVWDEEETSLQVVSKAEPDVGGARSVQESEALVAETMAEQTEVQTGGSEGGMVNGWSGDTVEPKQNFGEEQEKKDAAKGRSEELAEQAQSDGTGGTVSVISVESWGGVHEEGGGEVAGGLGSGTDSRPLNLEGKVADLSQKLSKTEAARDEAEAAALELVNELAALRGQYEAFRQEKRVEANLQHEYSRLKWRLTWQSVAVAVQVALFLYFAMAVAGDLGLCGFSSPT